jgi:hypothetical protein
MFGHKYYHGALRKYIIMFGNMFNDIKVDRFDNSGEVQQTLAVPISYGPRQRFIARLDADPNLDREVSITLPRLGFEFTSMNYAPERKLNSMNRITSEVKVNGKYPNVYQPVPYDLNFSLYVMVKNAEDGTQILEQILPFFTPDFSVTMNVLPDLDIKLDIPTVLQTVNSEDTYEGDFETRRVLTWQLDFVVKGYVFGPVRNNVDITTLDVNVYDESIDPIDKIFNVTTPDN